MSEKSNQNGQGVPSSTAPTVMAYRDAPTRTVDVGDVTYAYRELGPKGGIPVVFLVHLAANLDNWDPRIVDAVAAHRHVIAFDNRGLGATTGSVPTDVEAMTRDAVAFIRALGYQRVDLFGFSLGGMVAQELVVRHPELVRKLVLTGTGPKGASMDAVSRVTFYDIFRGAITRSDPKEFLFFGRDAQGRGAAREFMRRLEERSDRDKAVSLPAILRQLKAIKAWGRSAPHDLSTVRQPTLIANGDNDRMVDSALSGELQRRIDGSELIIYPNSGHGGIFQYHEKFAPALVGFLADSGEEL
ncbi:MAG: alpha/beta hydrolase [Rhodococcus sp. (in: high G+C Gram-positive bacteria)]|uniref:alpha/beta fold hydrolase n=2 Tax=unclassified Rhodococcus (in: high G+C Gram-positive bacteria) TaxID=192944 RepID=UPI001604E322|nr:alpha/beta hydrolase [Rhodococcus sp. SBT000017]